MIFDNDYNKYIKFIKQQHSQNNNQYEHEKKESQLDNYNSKKPYIQIIQPTSNNFPVIKIIKYPNNDRYKTTKTNDTGEISDTKAVVEFTNTSHGSFKISKSVTAEHM